jgi:hypothetical protein
MTKCHLQGMSVNTERENIFSIEYFTHINNKIVTQQNLKLISTTWPTPLTALSKASVYGRFLAGDWVFKSRRGIIFLFFDFYILSSRGLCNQPITRPKGSYRAWCAWEWSWRLGSEKDQSYQDCPTMTRNSDLIQWIQKSVECNRKLILSFPRRYQSHLCSGKDPAQWRQKEVLISVLYWVFRAG